MPEGKSRLVTVHLEDAGDGYGGYAARVDEWCAIMFTLKSPIPISADDRETTIATLANAIEQLVTRLTDEEAS